MKSLCRLPLAALALVACGPSPEPQGLRPTPEGTGAKVKFDVFARPLPEIPLPNDFATRYDPTSPTHRRVNASLIADTAWERATRQHLDRLDGWGTFAPLSVGFERPLDVVELERRHRGDDYDFLDDAVLVVNVTADSPDFCQPTPLDMGEGNFPLTVEELDRYQPNDPRAATQQLVFEEAEEDRNGNGLLDPGEDTDMDGVLDHPNLRHPDDPPLDGLLTFYERETNTLLLRPVLPLREETTYAVVLTNRLRDEDGRPVRSPFPFINHAQQTEALRPLEQCLPGLGLSLHEVAFTWSFTTQSVTRELVTIRDGLYGVGPLAWLTEPFPSELTDLYDIRRKTGGEPLNVKIVPGEQFYELAKVLVPQLVAGEYQATAEVILESQKFIDFHVVGAFESPQFFRREDEQGNPLPLSEQVWELDTSSGEAFVRKEKVTFWLAVPKAQHSPRPAPVVLFGHGHTSNKLDALLFAGFLARHGLATASIDMAGHGMPVDKVLEELIKAYAAGSGLDPMAAALLRDRAADQNGDGVKDSGADFWTAYVFHSRDMVRQTAVDYMRFLQLLRTFDGFRTWKFDANRDGTPELAGDFDADGRVDVSGQGPFYMMGISLGGIMTSVLGGLEPALDAVVALSSGGGLSDIAARSSHDSVVQAVALRMFGPLLLGLPAADGSVELWQHLPDLDDADEVKVAVLHSLREGDTAVLWNTKTGDYRCAPVQTSGRFRVAVPSDAGDELRLDLYPGLLPPKEHQGCLVPPEAVPHTTVDTLGVEAEFQKVKYPAGQPLRALGDGFGLRRGTPEMRRFMQIAQIALEPADPVNFAPHYERRLLRHGTGEAVRTRALLLATVGDTVVPTSTGASVARAAGFIELFRPDPRWGKTPNRVLIDTGMLEGTERTNRHVNAAGQSVLVDVEHLALLRGGNDGLDVPRLNPPLRLVQPSTRLGGQSGALFPMVSPLGTHVMDPPNPTAPFDTGSLILNLAGRYLQTGGEEVPFDPCLVDYSCAWLPPVPP